MIKVTNQDNNKKKLLDLFITGTVFEFSAVGIHEYFHAMTSKLLGFDHKVIFDFLAGTTYFPDAGSMSTIDKLFIGWSGGIITSILFFLLAYFSNDKESSTVAALVGFVNLCYGITEGIWFAGYLPKMSLSIGVIIGAIMFIVFLITIGFEDS